MEKEKYYVFCTDITREGWYEEYNTLEEALEYIDDNYSVCELLIKGTEIEYSKETIKTNLQFKNFLQKIKK